MIYRWEFEGKLAKELLRIVHYNLQTSIRLSLFSKDVKVEQSFNSSGSLFHKLAALNINDCCPFDCLTLDNFKFLLLFLVSWHGLRWILKTSRQWNLPLVLPLALETGEWRAVEGASQGASIIVLATRFWRWSMVLEWLMKLSPQLWHGVTVYFAQILATLV